jgi:hypothetical protein
LTGGKHLTLLLLFLRDEVLSISFRDGTVRQHGTVRIIPLKSKSTYLIHYGTQKYTTNNKSTNKKKNNVVCLLYLHKLFDSRMLFILYVPVQGARTKNSGVQAGTLSILYV